MQKNLMFLLFFILVSAPALAATNSNASQSSSDFFKEIYFNLGSHTEFYNAVQKDDSGGLRKFDFAPAIGMGVGFSIIDSLAFLPEFNWVLPQTAEDSKIIINTFMFRGDLAYDPIDSLRLRLGTSLIWQNQHGRGGKTTMKNGNDESTFYYPDENRSSLNNTFDLGAEAIWDQFAFRLQTYTYSIFKEEQRQISYTLFLTYYWEK